MRRIKCEDWKALPGGGDHDDGPRVDQIRVEESAPAAAVQVGAFDHIRVGVHPEHQPTVHVHGQALGADQICTEQQKTSLIRNACNSSYVEIRERHQVSLLVLMSISGSAPGATEALLMVLADRSVQ